MPTAVLFVCSQNICRSMVAQSILSYLISETNINVVVDSAGIHASDKQGVQKMVQKAASLRGYDLSDLRSRQLQVDELKTFDYVLAVDKLCWQQLQNMTDNKETKSKIDLLMSYSRFFNQDEIPYPTKASIEEFSRIFDYAEDACLGLLEHISQ